MKFLWPNSARREKKEIFSANKSINNSNNNTDKNINNNNKNNNYKTNTKQCNIGNNSNNKK